MTPPLRLFAVRCTGCPHPHVATQAARIGAGRRRCPFCGRRTFISRAIPFSPQTTPALAGANPTGGTTS